MPKKDFSQRAFYVFQQAVGEQPKPIPLTNRQVASQKGGRIGGLKRASRMSPEERSALASHAAKVRWKKDE